MPWVLWDCVTFSWVGCHGGEAVGGRRFAMPCGRAIVIERALALRVATRRGLRQ